MNGSAISREDDDRELTEVCLDDVIEGEDEDSDVVEEEELKEDDDE